MNEKLVNILKDLTNKPTKTHRKLNATTRLTYTPPAPNSIPLLHTLSVTGSQMPTDEQMKTLHKALFKADPKANPVLITTKLPPQTKTRHIHWVRENWKTKSRATAGSLRLTPPAC